MATSGYGSVGFLVPFTDTANWVGGGRSLHFLSVNVTFSILPVNSNWLLSL